MLLPLLVVVVAEGSEAAVDMVGLYVSISLGLLGSHLVCRFTKIATAGLFYVIEDYG